MCSSGSTPGDLYLALAPLISASGRDARADPGGDSHISPIFLRGNKRRLLRPRRTDREELERRIGT